METHELYRPGSIRNQARFTGEPRYIGALDVAEYWATWQDRDSVAEHFADDLDGVDLGDYEEGYAPCARWPFGRLGAPAVNGVYPTEAEAIAAAREYVMQQGYTISDRDEAVRLSDKLARERIAAADWRRTLRRRLRELLESRKLESLADALGVAPKHRSNLAKFIVGKKPDVPGDSLTRIAQAIAKAEGGAE